MNASTYSQKTLDAFIRDKLCKKDPLTYKYYKDGQVEKFRKKLGRDDDTVDTVVQTFITDSTRYYITEIIGLLTAHMKPYGDLIVSGGEAINTYLDINNRIITTDIDTKFTPIVKVGTRLLQSDDIYMFGYIQLAKLRMWNKLGQLIRRYNSILLNRIKKDVIDSHFGKMLGIKFPKMVTPFHRRYTLIKKNKMTKVLVDIELFAIDLQLRYYVPSKKRVCTENIGGVLDIAFMRPLEFGYEASYTRNKGIPTVNPETGKNEINKNVLVASPRFLIHDIYSMQKYNLRPEKKEKDRKRLYYFAKYIMQSKTVSPRDSIEELFRKSIRLTLEKEADPSKRPGLTEKDIARDMQVDPYKYESITTKPKESTVYKQLFYGIKTSENLNIPGYNKTMGSYRFNTNKGNWVQNKNPLYIHNEATHRPMKITNFPTVPIEDTLYGYSPARNIWMPRKLVKKAAMIPFVGLKIKTVQ
jgi:hypothetical protein